MIGHLTIIKIETFWLLVAGFLSLVPCTLSLVPCTLQRNFALLLKNDPMRIISYNVNGLRAAISKGFLEWLKTDPADVICLQEIKARRENVDHKPFHELGYSDYWFSARKKGYSGVAVFTKVKPDIIQYGTGHKLSDEEGRVLQLDLMMCT
jgi:hypothetical protein